MINKSNTFAAGRLSREGKIWLVGAGPGDADLLTIKALKAIQGADLIFFDQLVSSEIQALFPKGVPAFYVGKKKNQHSVTQDQIHRLMVNKALEGAKVVRVKGGDPFVFGRGGEEYLEAARAGIDVEVVPGITAASGCATSANIPLTHRGLSQACTFITAHAEKDLSINWRALAQLRQTLVVYMGVSKAPMLSEALIDADMPASTPVAIVENGCRADQRVLRGCLGQLSTLVERESVRSPAIIIVGEVVAFPDMLEAAVAASGAGYLAADDALLASHCA